MDEFERRESRHVREVLELREAVIAQATASIDAQRLQIGELQEWRQPGILDLGRHDRHVFQRRNMPEMLNEGRIVGILVGLAINVRLAAQNAGADARQRIKERDFTARRRLQRLRGGVDFLVRAGRTLDGADDGFDVRVLFGGREDGRGVIGERLLERGIGGGRDDGIEVGP